MALWLRERNIDIRVVEIMAYRDGDTVLLVPRMIIPPLVAPGSTAGRPVAGPAEPWQRDGRSWHLEKRCGPRTREMLSTLEQIIKEAFEGVEVHWTQKFYVSFCPSGLIWLVVETKSTMLILNFRVRRGSFDSASLAKRLGVHEYDPEADLASKLKLGSSVAVEEMSPTADVIRLRLKEDFNVQAEEFVAFLKDAYKAWPKRESMLES